MVISETRHKINALNRIVPDGFVFLLDTTDRSFLYKSKENPDFEQRVISLDKVFGIDVLTKNTNFYKHVDRTSIVKLSRISPNTFIGVCAHPKAYSEEHWDRVADCLASSDTLQLFT